MKRLLLSTLLLIVCSVAIYQVPTPSASGQASIFSQLKRIQYSSGSMAAAVTSVNVTISAVDTSRSFVVPLGPNPLAGSINDISCGYFLSNSTTVQILRGASSNTTVCYFAVVEFYGTFKSIQYANIDMGSSLTGTATISAVTTTKTLIMPMGTYCSSAAIPSCLVSLALTNTTTVTATRTDTATGTDASFAAIEY